MKKINLALAIFSTLLLTSCFEIIEDIIINKDQSGSITYKLETDPLIAMFMENFSLDQGTDFQVNEGEIYDFATKLQQQDGIIKVDYSLEPGNQFFSIDFKNAKLLNKALYANFDRKKNFISPSFIKVTGHKLKKINISPFIKQYLKHENVEIPQKDLLSNITITTSYTFPSKIRRMKGIGIVKNSDNTATHKVNLLDFIENKNVSSVKIKY